MRLMLAELATGQARHEHLLQQYAEQCAEYRAQFVRDIAAAGKILRNHAKVIAAIDASQARSEAILERTEATLDRATRKLEVHGDLIAELIRN